MSSSMEVESQAFWTAFNECYLKIQSTRGLDKKYKSL